MYSIAIAIYLACVDLTKDSSIILYLQEECDSLIDATIKGDMEVVSTLISDGVDMNAIVHEVCITTTELFSVSVFMSVIIAIHMHA